MPRKTKNPEQIIHTVDLMESQNHLVRERMDEDFDRYRLLPYEGPEALDNYEKFTSNDPKTIANLAMHLINTAQVRYAVHQPRAQRPQRGINNMKELFVIGAFNAANERRAKLLMPPVQDAMGSQCILRGRRATRVLLVKEEIEEDERQKQEFELFQQLGLEAFLEEPPPTTRTYVDITDWDPRNTYWGMGRHGLAWACHKVEKTREQIVEEYDVDESVLDERYGMGVPMQSGEQGIGDVRYLGDHEETYDVYDYFDTEINTVILEGGMVLKPPTPHGMGRVPVSIGIVGSLPFMQGEGHDYSAEYGESIYAADRDMFDYNNLMLSIMAELTTRSIHQPLLIRSRDGSLTTEGDPRETGAEVPLSTQNEEDIVPLPPMEMVKETGLFISSIQAMMQRGSFPYTAFGELAFQLSGYAINSLRQGMEVPIMPAVKSMMTGMKEIGDILCDAYASGNFDTMELSGKLQDPQRTYFSEEITPDMVREAGILEVTITPQLPQDDQTKVQLAALATSGELPLVDMRFARENYLGLQDVDQVERAVFEQIGDSASPAALAMRLMNAAAEQGDMEKAEIYFIEFQTLLIQKLMDMGLIQSAFGQMQAGGAPMGLGPGMQGGREQFGGQSQGSQPGPQQLPAGAMPSQMGGTPQRNTTPGSGPGAPRPNVPPQAPSPNGTPTGIPR